MRPLGLIAIIVAVACGMWLYGKNRSNIEGRQTVAMSDDLDGARAAFQGNIAAIQHRNAEQYLSYYMQSPALTILSDSFAQGYDSFAAARRATTDWPDTLIAGDPRLVWLSPGVVYGAYKYVRVQKGDTTRGWSERVMVKTKNGWKVAVTTVLTEPKGSR